MKSLIKYLNQELIIETKRNRLVSSRGAEILKDKFLNLFKSAINVSKFGKGVYTTRSVDLEPGSSGYILAILIEKIKNEFGAMFEYNIKE